MSSTWLPVIGVAVGSLFALFSNFVVKNSSYLRNLTVGIILAVIAIELIPRLVNVTNRIPIIIGIILGAILIISLYTLLIKYRTTLEEGSFNWSLFIPLLLESALVTFLIGITLNLGGKTALLLSIAFGIDLTALILGLITQLQANKVQTNQIAVLVSILIILSLTTLFLGYYLGRNFINTKYYYFIIAFAISVLIWLIVERLLVNNLNVSRSEIPIIASIVFIGFLLTWLIS